MDRYAAKLAVTPALFCRCQLGQIGRELGGQTMVSHESWIATSMRAARGEWDRSMYPVCPASMFVVVVTSPELRSWFAAENIAMSYTVLYRLHHGMV